MARWEMNNQEIEKAMLKYLGKKLSRSNAIRIYCKEMCSAGDLKSWGNCSFYACPLWKFRKGRETLGNQTSFKKHTENKQDLIKISTSTEEMRVQNA